jgi:ketosteroid isomerase-like protein
MDYTVNSKRKEPLMTLTTTEVIRRFEDAFQSHDPSDLLAVIADNCRLENTGPAPDGAIYQGQKQCVDFWSSIASNPGMRFDEEKIDILGDRAIITWRLTWGQGKSQSVRGVNIMRVYDGKIVEALGYVKS